MLNPASISRSTELWPPYSYTGLRLLNIEQFTKSNRRASKTESKSRNNMSSSPSTPTSASSSNTSEMLSTPTSPRIQFRMPVWSTNNTPKPSMPVANVNTPTLASPARRKLKSRYTLSPPLCRVFAEQRQRPNEALSFLGTVASEHLQTHAGTDQDGDAVMSSPSSDNSSQGLLESVVTSPILGRLIGAPVRVDRSFAEPYGHQHTTSSASKARTQARNKSHCPVTHQSQSEEAESSGSPYHRRSSVRSHSSRRPPQIAISDDRSTHLQHSIDHLGIRLVPLISVTSGREHPEFPRSILQYHLLTHDQLDSLARWYHQTIDNRCERFMYPGVIERPWSFEDKDFQKEVREQETADGVKGVDLTTKRRRFGRFIGLKGCETPVVESNADGELETLADKMDREWRAALRRARDEEEAEEKMWRGRW